MTLSNYSYLDFTVMPFLRKKVISADAAILFNSSFEKVLWANATGADLFGGNGIFSLLDVDLSENHPLVKQLKNASRQLEGDEPIVRGFRVARGLTSDQIQGEMSQHTLPNGEQVALAVFKQTGKTQRLREYELALKAVNALDGFADASAIVDDYGLVLASSKGFDTLEIDPDTLESLISIVAREEDRLVKRKVKTASGRLAAAGLGRIRDVPGRFLIVVADADDAQETSVIPEVENIPSALIHEEEETFQDEPFEDEASISVEFLENDQDGDDLFDTENAEVTTGSDIPGDTAFESADLFAEENDTKEDLTASQVQKGSLLDRWYFTREDDEIANRQISTIGENLEPSAKTSEITLEDDGHVDHADDHGDDQNTDPMPKEYPAAAEKRPPLDGPKRFAFVINHDHVVQSVSGELMQAVGVFSGDITGKSWKTISTNRRFDENGVIQKLLEKADTWSGKSVLWPVDGTDMVIPVDLAALPVYDRERNFDGFRGFGIIRVEDAIVDPRATGLNFTSKSDQEEPVADIFETAASNLPNNTQEPSDEVTEETWPTGSSIWRTDIEREDAAEPDTSNHLETEALSAADNIFHLPKRAKANPDLNETAAPGEDTSRLSGKEKQAFSEISRSLSSDIDEEPPIGATGLKEDDKSETTAESSETEFQDVAGESSSILETLPVPLVIYRSAKTLFANDAFLELAGYGSLEDLDHAGGIDAIFPRNGSDIGSTVRQLELKRKDGSTFHAQTKLTTVVWKGEKSLCLSFNNAADTNAQPQGEEKSVLDMARVSELENILETAADGILVLDEDGKIESLNASGEALFGRLQGDVVGTSFGKLFATESRQSLEAYIRDINTPGVSGIINQGLEVIGLEANGGMIPLFATIGRVGQSHRYCAVLRDLTEWKRNEEELVKAKHNAETASEQKSEFLSRMSHEIREPLNAIIGFSDVMIEERFGRIENERYREYLKDINRSGIHVLDLVNDLLDISKIEAGKLELSYEAVDLNQLAAETIALLQPQANNKRILIRTSLSRAVPKVVADARSIRQIILNLVSNAINHSPQNSQVIVSTTYEENSEVGLRIRDTGKGMNKEQLARALEPFSQVGDDRHNGGGTGLGLPLTKALVEANRAYFELESTPGEGTIAHIQFPSQRVLAD